MNKWLANLLRTAARAAPSPKCRKCDGAGCYMVGFDWYSYNMPCDDCKGTGVAASPATTTEKGPI